jgi:hypothetical protein
MVVNPLQSESRRNSIRKRHCVAPTRSNPRWLLE